MAIKDRPCAYCGSTSVPRTKGHVISKCMYPSTFDIHIQKRTVAECTQCQQIWQDAENHFRNILVLAGEPGAPTLEQWEGPMRRSFDMPSGRRWISDILTQMVPASTRDPDQYKVFPARDSAVMLVVRKIIRGLSSWHRLEAPIADERVWADVKRYPIQENLLTNLKWFD